mmetsp:Transcript_77991/g.203094  ORF Transcript_77991/g.203094 Transcript_77991/m.203094 type:complete len:220 (+) Transcript_77991:643-1302(+)
MAMRLVPLVPTLLLLPLLLLLLLQLLSLMRVLMTKQRRRLLPLAKDLALLALHRSRRPAEPTVRLGEVTILKRRKNKRHKILPRRGRTEGETSTKMSDIQLQRKNKKELAVESLPPPDRGLVAAGFALPHRAVARAGRENAREPIGRHLPDESEAALRLLRENHTEDQKQKRRNERTGAHRPLLLSGTTESGARSDWVFEVAFFLGIVASVCAVWSALT